MAMAENVVAGELQDSLYPVEIEDSLSLLYIKPIQQSERLLKPIIERMKMDLTQKHEAGLFRVDAQFIQPAQQPFSVGMVIKAEPGITLENVQPEVFDYDGPYGLVAQDSDLIHACLLQFATMSPVHVHKAYYPERKAMSPLTDFKQTIRCFDVTADSIGDETGRTRLRFRFKWKKHQPKDFDWERYNGEITGTAYFNPRSLRLTLFSGEAYLPSLKYVTRLKYVVQYDELQKTPAVRSIEVWGTKDDMEMKAMLQRVQNEEE